MAGVRHKQTPHPTSKYFLVSFFSELPKYQTKRNKVKHSSDATDYLQFKSFQWSAFHVVRLSPGQTIATCQHNISQHCWAQHVACVWPPCCDVLQHVGCCWLTFETGQIWPNNTQHVATCRNKVAKRTQHVAPNNVAICCVGMLRSFGRGFEFKLHVPVADFPVFYWSSYRLSAHIRQTNSKEINLGTFYLYKEDDIQQRNYFLAYIFHSKTG